MSGGDARGGGEPAVLDDEARRTIDEFNDWLDSLEDDNVDEDTD
jgi:hypothetical protein